MSIFKFEKYELYFLLRTIPLHLQMYAIPTAMLMIQASMQLLRFYDVRSALFYIKSSFDLFSTSGFDFTKSLVDIQNVWVVLS